MSLSLLAQVALAAGPIVAFLEGTVVYALSQQWEDLLSTYLFLALTLALALALARWQGHCREQGGRLRHGPGLGHRGRRQRRRD